MLGLIIATYPFKISLKLHINFVTKQSFYSIKVVFIKLLCGTTYIEDNRLVIQNSDNLIYTTGNQKKQMEQIKQLVKKIVPAKLQIYFSGGIQNDAYQTAMLCGYIYAITSSIFTFCISKNNFINIFQDIDPQYNSNALDVTTKCILQISLLDVIVSLVVGNKKYKEKMNEQTKQ